MTLREQDIRCDGTTARLDRIEAYWRGLSAGALAPPRAAIDPNRIGAALPCVFLLDAVAPGVGRLRLAGREICEIAGSEARGENAFISTPCHPHLAAGIFTFRVRR
ncbi:PAS domain-containing protein, partial [Limimaricola sp. ASW11-118]